MTTKPSPDWELAEKLYRAGQLSLRMIAAQCGVTDTAIRKKAKKDGWTRDLTEKVRQEVRKALVRSEGSHPPAREPDPRTEREIIEQAAASAVQVVREHRTMLVKAGTLAHRLFRQLDDATASREDIEAAIHEEMDPQIDNATGVDRQALMSRRRQMLAAVSLPGHAATFRDLSTAVSKFITVERQSWGLDDGDKRPEDPFAGLSDEELARRESVLAAQLSELEGKKGGNKG